MNIQEKVSNICLAFKFVILDYAYSKTEILTIISNTTISQEIGSPKTEVELTEIIETYSKEGNIIDATKIIIELLRKKTKKTKSNLLQIIKTLDTLCWLNGLEKYKLEQINEIIDLNEAENFKINNAQIEKINECLASYQDYDIQNYFDK